MKNYIPQIGDMIGIRRGFYTHVGIYAGSRSLDGRDVVHNDKGGGVVLSTLADFSAGAPVFLVKAATGGFWEREQIVQRFLSRLGQKFNLLTFNCEHAANWAQSGEEKSPQLQTIFALAAIGLVGLALCGRKS